MKNYTEDTLVVSYSRKMGVGWGGGVGAGGVLKFGPRIDICFFQWGAMFNGGDHIPFEHLNK